MFKEQSDCQQQISDVAHPEHVTQFIDLPVVNGLREEESERQEAKQAQLFSRQASREQRSLLSRTNVFSFQQSPLPDFSF